MTISAPEDPRVSHHERALLLAAQDHDRHAEEQLVRRYEPLIQAVCARHRRPPGCDRQDLAQEARIGLCRAIRAWQPARGPFPAFAACCVTHQVLKALDSAGTHKHQLLSRAMPLTVFDRTTGSSVTITPRDTLARAGRCSDPVAVVFARERLGEILGVLPQLTARERAVLAGSLNDKGVRQLAGEQACRPQTVHALLRRTRLKLAGDQWTAGVR